MRAPEYHWIALDIETCPREDAELWFPPVEPDKRITKDEEKKAASIAEKQAAQRDKAAVDWNTNRIVVLGYQTDDMSEPIVLSTHMSEPLRFADGWSEFSMLDLVWRLTRSASVTRTVLSFNGIRFDVPVIVQRSRYLGVKHPHLSFRKWDNPDIRDLYMELTFDDAPCTHIMERSLDNFCRQFGIDIEDDVKGEDVPGLWAAGEYQRVIDHCRRDVEKTVALARAIGVILPVSEAVEVF